MHECKYCTICCMDFRFQETMAKLLKSLDIKYGEFDQITIPGGAGDTARTLKYIALSKKLHNSNTFILTGHEDCGAGKTLINLKNTVTEVKNTFRKKKSKHTF